MAQAAPVMQSVELRRYTVRRMLSIVIPAHNEEGVIADTLKRLREKLWDIPHEIILSDDGSTDATVEKATPYADRIVRYDGELPKTIGAARGRGARAARGDILVFFDSDVRVREPQRFFPAIIKRFADDPKLVGLTVSTRVYPERETWVDRAVLGFFDFCFRVANNVLGLGVTHGKCMVVRASAFTRIGGFAEHIAASEDAELFMRLARVGKTRLDPTLRVYHSGRRAHTMGWPSLLWLWGLNGISVVFFKRAYSHAWERADTQ